MTNNITHLDDYYALQESIPIGVSVDAEKLKVRLLLFMCRMLAHIATYLQDSYEDRRGKKRVFKELIGE